jgi:hypothetical protein
LKLAGLTRQTFFFGPRFNIAVVPYNQPAAAMDLLNRFLRNETFVDVPAPTIRFGEDGVSSAFDMANPLISTTNGPHRMSVPVIVSLAFMAGIVFTMVINKFWTTRRQINKGGYSPIPENDTVSGISHFETSSESS